MTRKILLLGATGRTGQAVIADALERGWSVRALARRPEALTPREGLEVVPGTPLDRAAVDAAMTGCDAVVSVLNNNRASDGFFAKPVSPAGFMTDAITNTLDVMQDHGLRRIAILSAAGVGDSFAEVPWIFRMIIRHTNLAHTYRDHDMLDALIRQSGLDWTLARAVMLGNKPATQPVIVSYGGAPKPVSQRHNGLSNFAWSIIAQLLPNKPRGVPRVDDCRC
jgi:uncharacterized protein YbjT (DUF2867 family)